MKERIKTVLAIAVIVLLLPYVMTVLLTGKTDSESKKAKKSGKMIQVSHNGIEEKIDLQDYIAGVVAAQVPTGYGEEAIKAVAVLVRTLAEKKMTDGKELLGSELNLKYFSMEDIQKLWGYEKASTFYDKVVKAVNDTGNSVVKYNGEFITPLFHSVSAGHTRSGNEVFASEDYPYLVSTACSQDVEAENYLKTDIFTKATVIEKVKGKYSDLNIGEEALPGEIEITERDSADYVKTIRIGNITMAGEEFKELFGLNSSSYMIEEYEGNIRMTTKGIGHGLGLSLFGANCMAKDGAQYSEILSYYFLNIEITGE